MSTNPNKNLLTTPFKIAAEVYRLTEANNEESIPIDKLSKKLQNELSEIEILDGLERAEEWGLITHSCTYNDQKPNTKMYKIPSLKKSNIEKIYKNYWK